MIEIEREQGDTALKIVSPQENKIVIELTNADMTELDITYEEMDYGNIETRRVIWTVLDRARHALSRDIDPSGKMLIETVPAPDGGCVLYITVLQVRMPGLFAHPQGTHALYVCVRFAGRSDGVRHAPAGGRGGTVQKQFVPARRSVSALDLQ